MEIAKFERMIRNSSLNLVCTLPIFLHFLVSFRTESGRIQTDMLAFGRDEFEMMTVEEALMHIRACEKRLLTASKTQQGVVVYEEVESGIIHTQKPVVHFTHIAIAINYPAH